MKLSELAERCHQQSVDMGWWNDCPTQGLRAFKWYICTKLCLIHSEIDEASDPGMDGHLPHRSAFEVELADTVIRIFDLTGYMGWKYLRLPDMGYDVAAWSTDEFLLGLHKSVSQAMEAYRKGNESLAESSLSIAVGLIEAAQPFYAVDIHAAIIDKLAYNLSRADHQLANRQADGGKAF